MKVLENKIQEQSKEISIRSKTIEELQYSLNILIEKYNELKKKYYRPFLECQITDSAEIKNR